MTKSKKSEDKNQNKANKDKPRQLSRQLTGDSVQSVQSVRSVQSVASTPKPKHIMGFF